MISYVAKIIYLFATTFRRIFCFASLLGQAIIIVITTILTGFFNLIESLFLFLQIVYEDNIKIFSEEIPNVAHNLINTCLHQLISIKSELLIVCNDIHHKLRAAASSVGWFLDSLLLIMHEVSCVSKNAVILFGDTLWFMLTFIPVQLPVLLKAVFKYVIDIVFNLALDIYGTLLKITNFLTDVPLESFIGIIFAIVLIRLFIHFKEYLLGQLCLIYWSCIRNFWFAYHTVYNYVTNSEIRTITQIASDHDFRTRDLNSNTHNDDTTDTLCVICQERQKCVLTLPCRHICLCTECCMRLYGYQRTCPICRTFIYHSVTVYM